jgi:citrate synthase
MENSVDGLMTTAEVARRLGVKRETVYAYVSRGLLTRDASSDRRRSLFHQADVEALADRARHGNRSGAVDATIRTELTLLDPAGRLFYRGRDAVELARHRSFEEAAALLWDRKATVPWRLARTDERLLASMREQLPEQAGANDLIAVAVAALATVDLAATDRRPEAVCRAAERMCVGATVIVGAVGARAGTVAERLWRALSTRRGSPPPREVAAVNAALVLLADHELSASALAARVAASAWADPYRVVLAGLGPLGGALHAGTSAAAIFTVARIAGLIAHALEEYPYRLRFRPRASYVGTLPRPASSSSALNASPCENAATDFDRCRHAADEQHRIG